MDGHPARLPCADRALPPPPLHKLTADELAGLQAPYNLGDAHTHQDPSSEEAETIIARLPEIFWEAARGSQHLLDKQGAEAFLRLSRQTSLLPLAWYLPVYSSSVAMEIIANALRMRNCSVLLTEPTFDNIPDILTRQGIPVSPLRVGRHVGYLSAIRSTLVHASCDVLMLVLPNNPTGHQLTSHELTEVAKTCQEQRVSLILDVSFRLHDPRMSYDQYEILTASGVDFIVVEDTGKIWPTTDLKLAYILASESWQPLLKDIHQDILLNVSPFVSCLVRYYSELSLSDDLYTVRDVLRINRAALLAAIRDGSLPFVVESVDSQVGVEFLRVTTGESANDLATRLASYGITILSGEAFYWSNPTDGVELVRVALARDPRYFEVAIRSLANHLRTDYPSPLRAHLDS